MNRINEPHSRDLLARALQALRAGIRSSRRFAAETRGGVAPFIAVSIIPLVAFIGIGTDTARGYILKSKLSYALDSAALAAGKVISSPNRDSDLTMYFNANFPAGYMNATLDGPHSSVSPDNKKVTITANATIGTTFMRVLHINTLTVSASTEATAQTVLMDFVLSMDVSGSMSQTVGGVQKIAAARTAATTLVNSLFGTNATNTLLKIGLVPWNSKVNVQTTGAGAYSTATTVATNVTPFINPLTGAAQSQVWYPNNSEIPLLSKPLSSWKGCVYARYISDGINNDADMLEGLLTNVGGKDWVAWEPIGTSGEPPNCSSCTPCYSKGITPLQSTKQTILNSIAALTNPTGNTNLPQGLDMAWQVLTSTAPYSESDANPAGPRIQAIVIMTDGDNMGGQGDAYKEAFGAGATAQGNLTNNKRLDWRATQIAANIKATSNPPANEVRIYAIQLGDPPSAEQEAVMKAIATSPDPPYYFYAPDAPTLQSAFQQIADNLSQLRLSK